MNRENTHRVIASAAVLVFALAALAFYSVRDLMAAFVLFSVVFLGLGIALLAVLSAEEAVVWVLKRTEIYFGRFRTRHFALAQHAGVHQRDFRHRG
ncbi:MAG TPA: hypothetical protein VNK23_00295 [Candidatus Dormibacteraeota bacterium]|nr:hypothetical protein [Candidatus Dormibacteraeota bacterium]